MSNYFIIIRLIDYKSGVHNLPNVLLRVRYVSELLLFSAKPDKDEQQKRSNMRNRLIVSQISEGGQ